MFTGNSLEKSLQTLVLDQNQINLLLKLLVLSSKVFLFSSPDCYSPPECSCRISENPLAEVNVNPGRDLATLTVWDRQPKVMQEVDLDTTENDTDMIVNEIDNITEVRCQL